jgi:hypothetical protein
MFIVTVNRPGFMPDDENVHRDDNLADARESLLWELDLTWQAMENCEADDPRYVAAKEAARVARPGDTVMLDGYAHNLTEEDVK